MNPQTMNLNQTIALSPDVISQEVSGETVLLDLESENYFGLDEVGTRIWQLIKETNELQLIFDTLLKEYDVSEERLQLDLRQGVFGKTRRCPGVMVTLGRPSRTSEWSKFAKKMAHCSSADLFPGQREVIASFGLR